MIKDKLYTTALELADQAAISDIEVFCQRKRDEDGRYWYMPWTAPMGDHVTVRKAIAYLTARDRIERHADGSGMVRFM